MGRLIRKKILHPLNKKSDFQEVFEHGLKTSSEYLVVYAKPNSLAYNRLGLSVSRKIGTAVIRNKTKRRLKEILRKDLKDFPLRHDFVIVARKAAVDAEFSILTSILSKFLLRLANENNLNCNS